MTSYLAKVITILWKDILAEVRTKEIVISMFTFALLVLVIFNFAFDLRKENLGQIAPGALWVAFTFAGVLGFTRSFALEKDKGSMEGLILCPVDRSAIYLGKLLGNMVFMLGAEAILMPVFAVLFDLPIVMAPLAIILLLGTLGFASVGTLFSAISVNTRTRETMMPILFFPISVPVILASVKSTALALEARPWDSYLSWINLLVVFDVIFLVLSFLCFEYVVEE